jgi:hypothetical protein
MRTHFKMQIEMTSKLKRCTGWEMLDYNGLDQRDCVPRSIPTVTTVNSFFSAIPLPKKRPGGQPVSAHLGAIVFVE